MTVLVIVTSSQTSAGHGMDLNGVGYTLAGTFGGSFTMLVSFSSSSWPELVSEASDLNVF